MNKFKRLLKQRLLWKITFTFWLTTACTIVANIYITKEISRAEFKSELIESKANRLISEAITIFELEGSRSLKRWYRKVFNQEGLDVVLLDKNLQPIAKPILEKRPQDSKHSAGLNESFFKPPFPFFEVKSQSLNGQPYTLKMFPSPSLISKFKPRELHLYRLGTTFIIIFIGSFFLYRSIAQPLLLLREASQKLSMGDFSIRTQDEIGNRKDELGELSQAFDQMAQRIENLLESQTKLFRDISHEIRTPLTRQKLALSLAKEAQDPSSYLEKIEYQNDIIEQLINQLLTLLKLESTAYSQFSRIDLSQLIQSVCDNAELEIRQKSLILNTTLNSPIFVDGDSLMLTRAIENILVNAMKYSPENGVIDINCAHTENFVVLNIMDQGPGINQEDLSKITKPFFREDSSRNQKTGGFGLGLAITQKILDQHHGDLIIENRIPKGLKVSIKLATHKN